MGGILLCLGIWEPQIEAEFGYWGSGTITTIVYDLRTSDGFFYFLVWMAWILVIYTRRKPS